MSGDDLVWGGLGKLCPVVFTVPPVPDGCLVQLQPILDCLQFSPVTEACGQQCLAIRTLDTPAMCVVLFPLDVGEVGVL